MEANGSYVVTDGSFVASTLAVGYTLSMSKVADVAGLSEFVASHFDELSPQLRNAVRYLLDHRDDVALLSMRELAQAAGLPSVTFVRLSRALGFADYSDLRRLFQKRLRDGKQAKRYSRKARDLQVRGDETGTLELLKDLFSAEMDNIELTFEKNHPDTLIRTVELIESAKRICVLGQRSCFPIGFFFNYVYRLFRTNSVLLQNQGGTIIDEFRTIGRGDLLIAISLAPYTREVVQAVQFAGEAGARIVAITDDPLSPIARPADQTLLVAAGTPSFFHSIVSMVALVQALLALLVSRGGKPALDAIEFSEKQLERFKVYWPDEPRKRRRR
jgi:DNA-binding MurR/RpiR family transcriptional regulator